MNRSTGTHCAVRGCTYNWRKLKEALNRSCFEHFPIKRCDCRCDAPFAFYRMPSEPDLKRQWLSALQLKNPPQTVYVCSFHFSDKKPTVDNPIPELYLGLERKVKKRRARCPAIVSSAASTSIPVKLGKRKSSVADLDCSLPAEKGITLTDPSKELSMLSEGSKLKCSELQCRHSKQLAGICNIKEIKKKSHSASRHYFDFDRQDVCNQWIALGDANGLVSDSQIANLLIQKYQSANTVFTHLESSSCSNNDVTEKEHKSRGKKVKCDPSHYFEQDVMKLWHSLGMAQGLRTDTDIADFLIQHFLTDSLENCDVIDPENDDSRKCKDQRKEFSVNLKEIDLEKWNSIHATYDLTSDIDVAWFLIQQFKNCEEVNSAAFCPNCHTPLKLVCTTCNPLSLQNQSTDEIHDIFPSYKAQVPENSYGTYDTEMTLKQHGECFVKQTEVMQTESDMRTNAQYTELHIQQESDNSIIKHTDMIKTNSAMETNANYTKLVFKQESDKSFVEYAEIMHSDSALDTKALGTELVLKQESEESFVDRAKMVQSVSSLETKAQCTDLVIKQENDEFFIKEPVDIVQSDSSMETNSNQNSFFKEEHMVATELEKTRQIFQETLESCSFTNVYNHSCCVNTRDDEAFEIKIEPQDSVDCFVEGRVATSGHTEQKVSASLPERPFHDIYKCHDDMHQENKCYLVPANEKEVFEEWNSVGTTLGLSTDLEIAHFLFKEYNSCHGRQSSTLSYICIKCQWCAAIAPCCLSKFFLHEKAAKDVENNSINGMKDVNELDLKEALQIDCRTNGQLTQIKKQEVEDSVCEHKEERQNDLLNQTVVIKQDADDFMCNNQETQNKYSSKGCESTFVQQNLDEICVGHQMILQSNNTKIINETKAIKQDTDKFDFEHQELVQGDQSVSLNEATIVHLDIKKSDVKHQAIMQDDKSISKHLTVFNQPEGQMLTSESQLASQSKPCSEVNVENCCPYEEDQVKISQAFLVSAKDGEPLNSSAVEHGETNKGCAITVVKAPISHSCSEENIFQRNFSLDHNYARNKSKDECRNRRKIGQHIIQQKQNTEQNESSKDADLNENLLTHTQKGSMAETVFNDHPLPADPLHSSFLWAGQMTVKRILLQNDVAQILSTSDAGGQTSGLAPKLRVNASTNTDNSLNLQIHHQPAVDHDTAEPHVCLECGATFTYASQLGIHAGKHFQKEDAVISRNKLHICGECSATFQYASQFIAHACKHVQNSKKKPDIYCKSNAASCFPLNSGDDLLTKTPVIRELLTRTPVIRELLTRTPASAKTQIVTDKFYDNQVTTKPYIERNVQCMECGTSFTCECTCLQ